MMRSALYYPHTEVQSTGLLKTSLLLWDNLEYIVPYPGYEPQYEDKHARRSIELIGKRHYPSDEEKAQAHTQIEALISKGLPPSFYLPDRVGPADYEIWPQKLLHKTWDLLEDASLAGRPLDNYDYPLSLHTGLTIMSILADCCAGSTRRRVTDRASAYATVAGLLNTEPLLDLGRGTQDVLYAEFHRQELVQTSLSIIDATAISLDRLIAFREREQAENGHAIRDIRHRYVERLEAQISALAAVQERKSDLEELKQQFELDMRDDIANLRDALRFARNEVLTSRDIITAAVAATGLMAGLAMGGVPPALSGVVTLASVPITIGNLLGARNKFLASRRAILEKHPMAYLLELEAS